MSGRGGILLSLSTSNSRALELDAARAEAVRRQLVRMLESPAFRKSKRSQRFLRFVVQATLEGHADLLKERTLAIEIFDRPAGYDPSADAAVRVAALEVRKRLDRCLIEEGPGDEVEIVLPVGSYVPVFRFPEAPLARVETVVGRGRRKLTRAIIAAIALAIVAGLAWLPWRTETMLVRPQNRVNTLMETSLFADFWRPVLVNPSPVIICLQSPPAYTRKESAGALLPAFGRFLEIGDAIGAWHIASVFSHFNKQDQTRIVGDLSFSDLRQSPAVLVGASMFLARDFISQFPFVIDERANDRSIREAGPPYRTWRVARPEDGGPAEDYAIAMRVFDSEPGQILIIAAGISHFGTKAASEFLSSAHYLSDALAQLPKGWQKKNMQFVIHTKIIGMTTGPPDVVAVRIG